MATVVQETEAMNQADALEALRQFIIQTRHAKKLTQRELARRGGIPHGTLGSIESGRGSMPNHETLTGIAKGLGVPVSILDRLTRGQSPEPDISLADLVLIWAEDDPEIRSLLSQAAMLPPAQRDAFAAGLRALVAALKPADGRR